MSSPLDYLELCRLCLVKDRVQVPIFEDDGDVNQIFLKIHACLPVKVSRDDKLPRKICSDCSYKLELFYQFWNTTANAEKQLLQWLGEDDGLDDKQQGYVTEVLDPNVMKQEGNSDSRLDNSVMQVSGHQNMDINMIENMSIITMPAGSDQQFTTVPMGTRGTVQTVQVPGPSTQTAHDQTGVAHLQEVEVDQEDEDNMDDGCDNDDGLPVKEETDEGDRSLEQSYVSLPCDEAGPSGLQQQKISEMSEITIQQTADGDHKTGTNRLKPSILKRKRDEHGLTPVDFKINSGSSSPAVIVAGLEWLKSNPEDAAAVPSATNIDAQVDESNFVKDNFEEYILPVGATYECDSCNEQFSDRSSLIIHKTERSIVRTRAALREPAAKFPCDTCQREFSYRGALDRHRHSCGPINLDELPASLRRRRRRQSVGKPGFTAPSEGRGEEAPAQCLKCGKLFKKSKYLRVHAAMAHGENIACQMCRGHLGTMAQLREHMRDEHSSDLSEFCHICGKGFHQRQSLKVHLAAHARDDKPLVCQICRKSFRHEVYLKKHVQQVHVELRDRKKYQCEHCGYETHYKSCFRQHMYKHTGDGQLPCDVCGKHLRRAYMPIHARIHTGEKPEVCEYCGKSFSARKYLTKHLITHTGEKPYQCRICHKRYTQRGTLTLHVRKHHPGEITDTRPWQQQQQQQQQQQLMRKCRSGARMERGFHDTDEQKQQQVIVDEDVAIVEIVEHATSEQEEPMFEEFVDQQQQQEMDAAC
ncbi:zinc finger and BTB domain-containing protein 47-like isoform X5 [Phymastichus coffea]|uniref:zinc finger and BTB domain-containing protein 47-like isoform X5 n=1 Tax=Phymastichus coffea TaxID=108790 RepID=UPI00273AB51F|nr:zinc finger and BTB domain-containing protein 47-like isoform X5 [Phymastichus coffea]